MASLDVISQDEKRISVRLKGIPLQYANALRRICLNGVMVFAVDTVDVIENTSTMADEGLAHRIGLVPLRTDLSEFGNLREIDTSSSTNRVMLVLDSGTSDQTRTIMSGDLGSEDGHVRPSSDRIPITQLAPSQKVKLEAYARLGRGTEHAKWNSANVSVLTEGGARDEHVLTVESTGALAPAQIITAAVDELYGRLGEFKEAAAEIKGAAAA